MTRARGKLLLLYREVYRKLYKSTALEVDTGRIRRMAYYLRGREAKNYKDNGVEIPRNTRRRAKEKLYPVEVLEEDKDEHCFRVHYIGYDEKYDEWIGEENIETLQPQLGK